MHLNYGHSDAALLLGRCSGCLMAVIVNAI
jgi:hypothetical protein